MVGEELARALRSGYDLIIAYTDKKFSKNTLKVYLKKKKTEYYTSMSWAMFYFLAKPPCSLTHTNEKARRQPIAG